MGFNNPEKGKSLRQAWNDALNDAENRFRQLISSPPTEWRRLQSAENTISKKGKARLSSLPEVSDVVVHRNTGKSGNDIYRLILEIPAGEDIISLEPWRAVLSTPELRQEWDPAVSEAHLVETLGHDVRISKTNFTLGWPANPRDTVTISRTTHDATTVIDLSTSLPRSADEPAYLRPSPPYVRSNVSLFAWCIQHLKPPPSPPNSGEPSPKRRSSLGGRIRITCFWQHDLRAVWNIGSSSGMVQQLSTMVVGLVKTTMKRTTRVPKLVGFGNGVTIERVRFQIDREALTVDYAIIPEDEHHPSEDLNDIREHKRLTRAVEFVLPGAEGWDVQVSTKASSEEIEKLPWTAHSLRSSSFPSTLTPSAPPPLDQIVLRLAHAPLINDHSILKVKVIIEISGPSSGLRLNGVPQTIKDHEERDPMLYRMSQVLPDIMSTADVSFQTMSSVASSVASSSSTPVPSIRISNERSQAAEKTILSREPEAKWKRTTEARGVTITQLDSIDPTLVVYRAEATFVGVGLWDLYAAVVSPGARNYWDKQHEDAILLEDVNELTELWHLKTKPAWPVNGRDSVVLKTVYKSPTTFHVFSFSADDPHLFPNVPPADPNTIRTQIDLQGWAIESLSPNTTLLTLLEQSDPKGWANKGSIPTQMINALAGIGEFAIKFGGPPVVTRLAGAKANEIRYDHERLNFRMEYEPSATRRLLTPISGTPEDADSNSPALPVMECEIRCDVDTWAQSLDIVVDPPPQTISCLRRHKLSGEGGGLWLSITHDAVFVDDERLQVIIRRGPGREKGVVMVNGAKASVDTEELAEHEIKSLARQKRVKPPRIPLDQPPVMGVIRRRRAEWADDTDGTGSGSDRTPGNSPSSTALASSNPRISISSSGPFANFFTYAVNQAASTTQSTLAAISPSRTMEEDPISAAKLPMRYALDALAWTQEHYVNGTIAGWTVVSDKGMTIKRKLVSEVSPVIPVHKGEKVIEGVSAEELLSAVTDPTCRKVWDERFDGLTELESFGAEAKTWFLVSRASFPFRDRGFYLASVIARAHGRPSLSGNGTSDGHDGAGHSPGGHQSSPNAIFFVTASFHADSVNSFAQAKYNPYVLPIGRVFVDAWVLETLDPYTRENYAVPSTRCTRIVSVDYAGSIPAAVNSLINAQIPRSILAVETFIKEKGLSQPLPITRLPAPGFIVTEKTDEEMLLNINWRLRKRDETRTLVQTKYDGDAKVYSSIIHVKYLLEPHPGRPTTPRSPARPEQLTPKASRAVLNAVEEVPSQSSGLPNLEDTSASSSTGISGLPPSSSSSSLSPSVNIIPKSSPSSPSTMPMAVSSHQRERSGSNTSNFRGRSGSSAFTVKGEVKHNTDLLVGEIVVDSKLYPKGYVVTLKARTKLERVVVSSNRVFKLDSLFSNESDDKQVIPLDYHIYTMPISPLHSSGLSSESPTRHLLKLTLPTAQYQISTVKDPLTGEVQHPPPKPAWLSELEEDGIMIQVEVRPGSVGKGKVIVVDGRGEEVGVKDGETWNAQKGGWEVPVLNEKESLTTLGREELLDDRVSKMCILSRATNESEPLPEELKRPFGVADRLLDPTAVHSSVEDALDPQITEGSGSSSENEEAPRSAYPNALTRFSTNGTLSGVARPLVSYTSSTHTLSGKLSETSDATMDMTRTRSEYASTGLHPTSRIIIVALIAFLIGSLLRSLLSPADFIYVVTDLREVEEVESGWREIRRLFELKYIAGGWDFQIAVSRQGESHTHIPGNGPLGSSSQTTMSALPQPQASSSTSDADSSSGTLSWEGDRMFNIYIYDYCYKRGYKKTARELLAEAGIPPDSHPPIDARQGLLFEWWSVFWVLFTAKANGSGSEEALIYTQHQAQQHANRMARLPSSAGSQLTGPPPPIPPAPLNQPPLNGMHVRPRPFMNGTGMPNGMGANAGGVPPMNGMPAPGQPPNSQPPSFQQQGPLANQQPRNQIGAGPPGAGPRPPNGLPFQSPTMNPNSPQNPGAQGQQPPQPQSSGPQMNQQHPQNPMGQLPARSPRMGPQGGMLPPNAPGQTVPGPNQTPTSGYQQLARPPSRSGSPGQGNLLTQHSPSMGNRQPPGMTPDMISVEVQRIPQGVLEQIKREVAVDITKDVNSMSQEEKVRIVTAHRARLRKGHTATTLAAGSPNVMLPPNQRGVPAPGPTGRPGKRNSTSGEEIQPEPGAGSSPPDSKRPRRSPMDASMGYPPLQQQGGLPGGPGGLPPQPGQPMPNGMMKPSGMPGGPQNLFGPQGGMQGPMGMGMGMQNNNGMNQPSMSGMPPPMGNTMSPAMGAPMSGPGNMMNPQNQQQQYRQSLATFHRNNISGMMPGPNSDPSFGGGIQAGLSRPGAGGPQLDPNAANRAKSGMGMLPHSPRMNKDMKDGKPDGSPHNPPTAGRTPTATGTAASTPVTNPAQPPPPLHQQPGQQSQGPTPNPGQPMDTSTSMLGNPSMSMVGAPQNSAGASSADITNSIFPADFLSNVATGLDEFDSGLFSRPDSDINFERDFGQWFNPEDSQSPVS
ncbi:hypothetical protein D9758_014260 [Tetrapyrgos nigripes]|uniref:START domain-containing protein n=1 Tax=Tetrapyrgos nigripes TaxID=182062 RepID=A0A8H5FI41_9AGAR|nr:hypothetical protein D9758_014260 [Tetrapyrgos nigripes]